MQTPAASRVLGGKVAGLTREAMSVHYIAVLVPENGGGWSVIFPDLPGCATHGPTVHEAITTASGAGPAETFFVR